MFKQRLLTALVLVPLVLFSIYYANTWLLGAVVLLFIMVGGWEWSQLIPLSRALTRVLFIGLLLAALWLSMHWFDKALMAGLILWGGILVAVLMYPASTVVWGYRPIVGGACLLLLPLFASTIAALYQHPQGRDLIVYLLSLVWATDIGAYVAGKCWGRHKLIPRVSPGKTMEGMLGGFLLAMLIALVGLMYFGPVSALHWFMVSAGTVLISMLGDLFISMLKRRCQLKDTGHIFPGHGGVLDRIDSLIAALPLFYCGLSWALG